MKNPLLEYRAFLFFFISRLTTTMANQMMMVVVAWQMYDLTHSAYDLGMFGSVALYGVATLVFAVSTSFLLSLIALAVTGAFDMVSVVIRQSLVQLETPNDMRGRVSAVNSIFIGASNQLGEFESSITAGWFGAVPSVLIGGLGTLVVVGAWMKLFPSLARREKLNA